MSNPDTPVPSPLRPEVRRWTQAADVWIPESEGISSMTRGATEGLVGALAPRPGERFVDLASGPGEPALSLARAVAPAGSVLAVDPVPGMLAELERRAAAAGLTGLTTRCAVVEELSLPEAAFDGLSCRFGAMFFDDPAAVLARLLPALVPGGRAGLLVWGAPEANPYFTAAGGALDRAGVPRPEEEPGTHGVFEHAAPGALAAHMEQAGWVDVEERELPFAMVVPDVAPADWLEYQAGRSSVMAERYGQATSDQRRRAAEETAAAVAPHARDGGLALPALARLVLGRRPG